MNEEHQPQQHRKDHEPEHELQQPHSNEPDMLLQEEELQESMIKFAA